MSQKAKMCLEAALVSTGLVLPVSSKFKGGSVEVLCKQVTGQERGWLAVIDELLGLSTDDWEFHICRRYLHKEGKMVFGWHVQVTCKKAKDLLQATQAMSAIIERARPSLDSVPEPRAPVSPSSVPIQVPTPAPPAGPPQAPQGTKFRRGWNDQGEQIMEVSEIPLPHVHRDLNVPNAKGKGATFAGSGDGVAPFRR